MAAWTILFAAILAVSSNVEVRGAECECGVASDDILSVRIVGGRRADPHSLPWLVALTKHGQMHCGGAVVTNKHVLSAGHCFAWDDYHSMVVLLGLDDMDDLEDVEKRIIIKQVIHEKFTSTPARDENDIAMITLDRPVEFSDTIRPVCLPKQGEDFAGQTATIAGWGRIGQKKSVSKTLLKGSVKVLSDKQCMATDLAKELVPTMMCAFSKGIDGCQGDSGGPLMIANDASKYYQIGVVSWGIGCANPLYPGVYTKVSDYVDWIRRHTADGTTCKS